MNKCTFCGREADERTKFVAGYAILACCTDCEEELLNEDSDESCSTGERPTIKSQVGN